MYKLTILGRYGPYPSAGGGTSAYLITADDVKFTLDFGSAAFSKLSGFLTPCDLDFMLLTHTHSDHTCDLGVMSYYLARMGKRMKVYMPKPNTEEERLRFAEYKCLDYEYIDPNTVINYKDLKITFFRLRHPVENYGVRAEYEGKIFVYTGDTNTADNLYPLLKNADSALMDGCFTDKNWGENKPHLSGRLCGRYCKESGVKKLILTHLDASLDEEELLREAKEEFGSVLIASEGGSYEITNEKN